MEVAISSPGLYSCMAKHLYQHRRRDLDGDREGHAVHHETVTIIGENDFIISIFDNHAGLVQNIACDESSDIPIACHLLEYTICHLLAHCGDHRGRWDKCSNDISTMFEFASRDVVPLARSVFSEVPLLGDEPWLPQNPLKYFKAFQ